MHVKSKLGTLRTQYLVHLKKETNSNSKSGMGTDEKVKPFWIDNLQFFKPYLKIKEQRTSNFDVSLVCDFVYINITFVSIFHRFKTTQ